ncbi:major facilitator superfamily domain-containing protein [Halteromyces radiatus]|uniref:major facilitator superfamily domain-containing protein n=1 Tax=Halteromyces radiatus TaxID=101107 RepID=UPI0022203B78|nr:major facilitator superfamily domain-containing protein [Halteromyces radiatus]KAI8096837.1 major facilitator superfamily domain-containing protein [Halteromyces radiatus]
MSLDKTEIKMEEDVVNRTGSFSSMDDQPFEQFKEEKKFVRKLSWSLLPLVWCIVFVQFVDKAMLAVAAVTGLLQDTQMTASQYSWASSVVYLGYLVYQIPNNILIQRLPHAKYLGVLITLWGVTVCATCAVQTFQQLMGLRFLLGLFEAGSNPVLYIILNTLYRRSEQSAVFGFMIISSGSGSAVGSAIGVAITYTLDHVHGWRAWRWGYLIFGVITIFLGIVTFFLLIDKPTSKLLRLTEAEKKIVEERGKDNMVVKTKLIKRYQIWEALKEPRLWCLCFGMLLLNLQNGGLISYSALLVQSLGFTSQESVILQIPSGIASATYVLISIIGARKSTQTIFTAMTLICVSLIGLITLVASNNVGGRLAGYYLSWAQAAGQALIITIIGNNVSGYTKKVTYNGTLTVFFTLGNFIGPLMMVPPTYLGGLLGYLASNIVTILLLGYVRWDMAIINKRRSQNGTSEKTDPALDLTDKEDVNYVYRL